MNYMGTRRKNQVFFFVLVKFFFVFPKGSLHFHFDDNFFHAFRLARLAARRMHFPGK